jgi:hypothetical protein
VNKVLSLRCVGNEINRMGGLCHLPARGLPTAATQAVSLSSDTGGFAAARPLCC